MSSKSFSIDSKGWKKVGKGLLIAAGGAAVTYLLEIIPGLDFGPYTALVCGAAAVVLNFLRKFLVSYQ